MFKWVWEVFKTVVAALVSAEKHHSTPLLAVVVADMALQGDPEHILPVTPVARPMPFRLVVAVVAAAASDPMAAWVKAQIV
jgi:hypothetical protein